MPDSDAGEFSLAEAYAQTPAELVKADLELVDPEPGQADDTTDPGHGWLRAAAHEEPGFVVPAPTWGRVDLSSYLDGTHVPPRPELFARTDGVSLLYRGLTHSLHGESESFKSGLMQAECVWVVKHGGRVLYIDHESDPGSVVERLLAFGATSEEIGGLFDYRQPERKPTSSEQERAAFEALTSQSYDLVVIDGVTESLPLFAGESRDPNTQAAEWSNRYPKLLAAKTGAAVVVIDHVTKNADTRGRFAIGGQHKMAAITGAAYSVDVIKPLGRGLCGAVSIRVGKDRPGFVRARSGEFRASDRTQEAAYVVIDSTGPQSVVTIHPPRSSDPDPVRKAMASISATLAEGPLNLGSLRKAAGVKVEICSEAVKRLNELEFIKVSKGPNNSTLHEFVKPYRLHDDPASPLYYPLDASGLEVEE